MDSSDRPLNEDELGRERRRQGKPFFFVMEEPELHIPPGLQRRLVAQAVSIAEQTICTSHSPRVAAYYPATSVQILDCRSAGTTSTPLLSRPLDASASNATRKLCHDDRPRVIEALMQHCVLIPEGRSEHEWFRLLADVLETGEQALARISDLAVVLYRQDQSPRLDFWGSDVREPYYGG